MKHTCHAIGCSTPTPPRMWGCGRHWGMVPRRLQVKLWRVYVPGQEQRKDPTPEYLVVAEECVVAVAVKEGHLTPEEASSRVEDRKQTSGFIAEMLPLFYGE